MRIVTGHISHETNIFSPIKTTYERFEEQRVEYGEEIFKVYGGTKTALGGIIDVCKREGVELIPTVAASAQPADRVDLSALDIFLGQLLDGIRGAGKIDGVCLALHGAMRCDEPVRDGEGYILKAVRDLVGPDIPITSSLDSHANMTRTMIDNADALHIYDTYPHVDSYETGCDAATTIIRTIRGEIKPTMGFKQIPLAVGLSYQYTGMIPMSTIMEYVARLEKKHPKVIDISVAPGFVWADFENALHSCTVVTDNDPKLAQELAQEVCELSWNMRKLFVRPLVSPADAVQQALAGGRFPVVLADVADNPGAGGSGDGVELLRALVEGGVKKACFGTVADPAAVAECVTAGVGANITLTLGAKTDNLHGKPVTVTGKVKLVSDGFYLRKGPMSTGAIDKMGKTVVLDVNGVQVLVTGMRVQPTDLEVFRSVGVEPTEQQIIVVKSCAHFRAAFQPIAKGGVIEVDCPGVSHPDLSRFTFKDLARPCYPLDEM